MYFNLNLIVKIELFETIKSVYVSVRFFIDMCRKFTIDNEYIYIDCFVIKIVSQYLNTRFPQK